MGVFCSHCERESRSCLGLRGIAILVSKGAQEVSKNTLAQPPGPLRGRMTTYLSVSGWQFSELLFPRDFRTSSQGSSRGHCHRLEDQDYSTLDIIYI
jgi:hypothetical protein